jgi:hypothetical protein
MPEIGRATTVCSTITRAITVFSTTARPTTNYSTTNRCSSNCNTIKCRKISRYGSKRDQFWDQFRGAGSGVSFRIGKSPSRQGFRRCLGVVEMPRNGKEGELVCRLNLWRKRQPIYRGWWRLGRDA